MKAKMWLISVALSLLIGAVGGWYFQAERQSVAPTVHGSTSPTPMIDKLLCLTSNQLAAVKSDPKNAIPVAFENCSVEIDKKTEQLTLTPEEKRIAFLSILAHSLAPYGASRSISLKDLLADKSMDCDNYAILTGYFNALFAGETHNLKFAGFDGGAVGNHAQLFVDTEKGLLLDPTIGLIARIGFDDLLQGKPLDHHQAIIFQQHDQPELDFFVKKVYDSVLQGKYKPSDLLYFFHSIEEYLKFSDQIGPLWGKNVDDLLLRFPTPAAEDLRKNLTN
ncbi:hypothetical protein D3C86_1184350 [compost metagenome]